MGGLGGVFRNHRGDWILGFQDSKPSTSPLQSELEALRLGLLTVVHHGLSPLIVETDATDLIHAVFLNKLSYTSIISDCMWLMHQLRHPKIIHSFRDGNKVAHKMAKDGLKHERKK
ncbi:PREDICTED: uncharacterized protein LOC109209504 [Nicotiana attenuata]|uniref:uncharacterized protein LOC109209504 n=1 Tax=Nicotiana attenuata TaxID=49451 RepID=UPI000905929B|nr:PREDICTED: uncharacterized protein LOC109209504 [Nicotiana attenuata]